MDTPAFLRTYDRYSQVWDMINNRVNDRMVLRDEDQAWIPFDEGNADYQQYLLWLAQGNRPTPAVAPPPPPPPPPSTEELMAIIQALQIKVAALEAKSGN